MLWSTFILFVIYKQTSIRNARIKLAKNQAKSKQHPEAEF